MSNQWLALPALLLIAAGVPAAAAPAAPAVKAPPRACATATKASIDRLLGLKPGTSVKEKTKIQNAGTPDVANSCFISHGSHTMYINTFRESGGSGGPFTCYPQKSLGTNGHVCVSSLASVHSTIANFRRHGVDFADGVNVTLPRHGKRMLTFAKAQYKAFK